MPAPPQSPQGAPLPKSVIGATIAATRSPVAPEKLTYMFAVGLSESGGVPATVTSVHIQFASCAYGADQIKQTRLPANGTLAMAPVACGYPDGSAAFNAGVSANFIDDTATPSRSGRSSIFRSVPRTFAKAFDANFISGRHSPASSLGQMELKSSHQTVRSAAFVTGQTVHDPKQAVH